MKKKSKNKNPLPQKQEILEDPEGGTKSQYSSENGNSR